MTRKDCQRLKLVNSSPKQAAKTSGLRYVTDAIRGITRRGKAKKFRYYGLGGERLRSPGELRRITLDGYSAGMATCLDQPISR